MNQLRKRNPGLPGADRLSASGLQPAGCVYPRRRNSGRYCSVSSLSLRRTESFPLSACCFRLPAPRSRDSCCHGCSFEPCATRIPSREIEPLISYNLSVIIGAIALGVSLWLGERLPLPNQPTSFLLVPTAFFTCLVGFVLLITRRKAITQVLGYLTLENGVYAFGAAVALEMPILVELGILT